MSVLMASTINMMRGVGTCRLRIGNMNNESGERNMKAYSQITVGLLAIAAACLSVTSDRALGAPQRTGKPMPKFDPGAFVTVVDNEFFPLTPGTTFFYEGEKDGIPASSEFHITHKTKLILGVTCIEVHDLAFLEGVLVEETFDWFAQDASGNVWYFGEDATELPSGSKEGSWEAGVDSALPGIVMETHPRVGDRYFQEMAPGVAEDMAQVLSLHASASIPLGHFDDLLRTRESSPLKPGVIEQKYYAEGVGLIRAVMVKGGDERVELVRITSENDPDSSEGQ
jgi:hypothetical protein